MSIERLFYGLILLTTLSACSNSTPDVVEKKTIIHRVEVQEEPEIVPLFNSEENTKITDHLIKDDSKKKTVSIVKPIIPEVAKKTHTDPVIQKPKVVVKPPPITPNLKVTKTKYVAPSYKAPVNNIQYPALIGDYATNRQALAFIDSMVAKHGFQKGYLNYLLSNTKATPFLLRMAHKDESYKKNTSRSTPRPGSWNRYRANFITERTIRTGVQFWKDNRVALQRAEQKYGVPKEYILGIIGVETRYGGNVGKNRAIDALAAMGFNNARRGKYFTSELEAFLLMTRREGLDPLKPMSSFAGALGLSQFMPSNIKRYAVDHDNSGSVNLWTPHDAIGSVANYFVKHGWKRGGTVAVPASSTNNKYKSLKTGFKSSHSLTHLKNQGVSAANLGNISGKASLIKLNTYSGDELWIGGHNFYVITRYNHSTHYGMAVHQLADAIGKRISGESLIHQASVENILNDFH